MSMFNKWKEWSQRLYDKRGKNLQAQYDAIKSWHIPEWAKEIVHRVDKVLLSTTALAFLKKFAFEVTKKFDDKMAKELIEAVVGTMMNNE